MKRNKTSSVLLLSLQALPKHSAVLASRLLRLFLQQLKHTLNNSSLRIQARPLPSSGGGGTLDGTQLN